MSMAFWMKEDVECSASSNSHALATARFRLTILFVGNERLTREEKHGSGHANI